MSRVFRDRIYSDANIEYMSQLMRDAQFQEVILSYWDYFEKSIQGEVQIKDVRKLFQVLFKQIVLDEKLGDQFTSHMEEWVSQRAFFEALTLWAFMAMEDVSNCQQFLQIIHDRVFRFQIVDIRESIVQNIDYFIQVEYFSHDIIELALPPELRAKKSYFPIYYQEKYIYDPWLLRQTELDPNKLLQKQLVNVAEVLPIGYTAESVVYQLQNNNHNVKEFTHLQSKAYPFAKDIKIQAVTPASFLQSMINAQMVPDIGLHFVIGTSRVHKCLLRAIQWSQQIMQNFEGEKLTVNVRSVFFTDEDYNVDQIQKLHARWERKAVNAKKSLLTSQLSVDLQSRSSNPDKPAKANPITLGAFNGFRIVPQLKIVSENLPSFESYMSKFACSEGRIPFDSAEPFIDDVIEYAAQCPHQILILSKERTGRSTIAKAVSLKLDIELVDLERGIQRIFNKVTENENNPVLDEEGNPKEFLSPLERRVYDDLRKGLEVNINDLRELLNETLNLDPIKNKGYILDIPITEYWVDSIISNKVTLPKIKCRYFTHVLELATEDVLVSTFMEKMEDLSVTSQPQRDALRRPKVKIRDPNEPIEDEEEEPPVDDEEKPPLPNERDLYLRPVDIHYEDCYKNQKQKLESLYQHLMEQNIIVIKIAGLTPDQITDSITARFEFPLRPLAIKLEAGSEKELLSVNLTDEKLYRMWSQWQQIDPVELKLKEKVTLGKVEFAADYAGRVFMFATEENLNKFLSYPRQYLTESPKLPKSFVVAIQGCKQSGKNTLGQQLAELYGWTLVDVEEIVRVKVYEQQQRQKHLVSSFDHRVNDVHLTEPEWKDFNKGTIIKDVIQMVMSKLQMPLQRKPLGWGEPKKEEEEQQQEEIKEVKKVSMKKKKEEQPVEVDPAEPPPRPATPPPEDVPTKEIIPLLDAEQKVVHQPKGILLIGYPSTQEQIDQLNLFNFKLDRVILLTDKSEEPGAIIGKRNPDLNIESEMAYQTQLGTLLKEAYQEENVKEVSIEGSAQEVLIRCLQTLDPFYLKPDDESMVRIPADVQEGEDPITLGDCASYCPVVLKQHNWLLPGKDDFTAIVRGRLYKFYGEKELQVFKENLLPYLKNPVPQPRIMLIGARGAGLRTQLNILNKQLKLPIIHIKDNLVQQLDIHKKNRQQERYFNKGFKPKELDGDGNVIVDLEIQDDPAEFDRKELEVKLLQQILTCPGVILNGNSFDLLEDQLSTPLVELLVEARRLPELVVLIRVEQDNFLKRNFDQRSIEEDFAQKMKELKAKRQQERLEARQKFIEENAAAEKEINEEELPPLDGNDEEDPEAPKLEDMLREAKEKLVSQWESDVAKLEELKTQFEELKIPVQLISSDTHIDQVTLRLLEHIEPVVDRTSRAVLFEKYLVYKLEPFPDKENFAMNRLTLYEKSYTHKKSRYGDRHPYTLQNVPICKDFPILYRNRIFYLASEEERDAFKCQPQQPAIPKVNIKPSIFIVGKIRSGKTTIAKLLSQKLKLVHIKVSHLLEEFATHQQDQLALKIHEQLANGQQIDNKTVIQLLLRRVQLADCIQNGYIVDGFPKTLEDAKLLSEQLIPTAVLICTRSDQDVLKQQNPKFGGIDHVINMRITNQIGLLGCYYQDHFNNVRYLDIGKQSRWGMFTTVNQYLKELLYARAMIARALVTRSPIEVSKLTLTEQQILERLSPLGNVCPVMAQAQRQFYANNFRANVLYFDGLFYVLSSKQAAQDFIANPIIYTEQELPPIPTPIVIYQHNVQPEFKGYCPVGLLNNQLLTGYSHLTVLYKEKYYFFNNYQNQAAFVQNPSKYKHARLPDKLPIQGNNMKNIAKKVAKRGDCTSYLELHLRNIVIKVLAQLGYKRIKYPTLSCKETVLKFIAISLKANNSNKDAQYRAKYQAKLNTFLEQCNFAQELSLQVSDQIDQEKLIKKVEDFDQFMDTLLKSDKQRYFDKFIH